MSKEDIGLGIATGGLYNVGKAVSRGYDTSKEQKAALRYQREAAAKSEKAQSEAGAQARKDLLAGEGRAKDYTMQGLGYAEGRLAPWEEAGKRGLADYEKTLGEYGDVVRDPSKYEESAGHKWAVEQGIKGLQAGAAASGKLDSGQNLTDLVRYNQGVASQGLDSYLARLDSLMARQGQLSGAGQTAAGGLAQMGMQGYGQLGQNAMGVGSGLGNIGMSTAANLGNIWQNLGQANAAYQMNQANQRTAMMNQLLGVAGTLGGAALGGAPGASMGGAAGQMAGNAMGGAAASNISQSARGAGQMAPMSAPYSGSGSYYQDATGYPYAYG